MIIDLQKFLSEEKQYWNELENILDVLDKDPFHQMSLDETTHFHYIYQRTSADLAKVKTFASEKEIIGYLESLVGRAYAEIHETRYRPYRLAPVHWFFNNFPQTFRRHIKVFWISVLVTLAGCIFGGITLIVDPAAKDILLPFPHLKGPPSERVAKEEMITQDHLAGVKTAFSSYLMTHNTKVAITVLAMGITWGVGTLIMLFFNGVILGSIAVDYIFAGETKFLLGWLLPHGVIEIPAILIAGQAGLVLAQALIGWEDRTSLKLRFRKIVPDIITLILGVAILLIWAGVIESFLSQYHEPFIPYIMKILFGFAELTALIIFLWKSGK